MPLTPHMLMTGLRRAGVAAAAGAAIALTGPFHYSDLGLPFPDTVAHALMFYALTVMLLAALPRSRSAELALSMLVIGAASEVAQIPFGREASLHDWAGDAAGVAMAYAPAIVAELRALMRTHPHVSFSELRRRDRRQRGMAPQPVREA